MDSQVEEQRDRRRRCPCYGKTSGPFATRPRFPHVYWTSASGPASVYSWRAVLMKDSVFRRELFG